MVEKLIALLREYEEELHRACLYYGAESNEAQFWLSKVSHIYYRLSKMTDQVLF